MFQERFYVLSCRANAAEHLSNAGALGVNRMAGLFGWFQAQGVNLRGIAFSTALTRKDSARLELRFRLAESAVPPFLEALRTRLTEEPSLVAALLELHPDQPGQTLTPVWTCQTAAKNCPKSAQRSSEATFAGPPFS